MKIIQHRIITDIANVTTYLERWSITVPFIGWSIKLHRIAQPDNDRCHHNHPWWFWRIILKGGYEETVGSEHKIKQRRVGSISFCPSNFQHRITRLHNGSSWSLVLTGKNSGRWGFFTAHGWVNWKYFIDMAKGDRVLWCSDGKERKKNG